MQDISIKSHKKTHLLTKSGRWVFLLTALLLFSRVPAQSPAEPAIDPEWEQASSSLNHIVFAIYDVISGPAGQEREWDKFRYLCHPEARLMPIYPVREQPEMQMVKVHPVENFIEQSSKFTEDHGFFEIERYREVQTYGGLTHVWSHYEGREELNGKAIVRGINSIQLFFDGKRWWVMSIFWQPESPELPLPKVDR